MTWPPPGTAPAARPVRAPWTVTGGGAAAEPSGRVRSARRTERISSSSAGNEMESALPTLRDSSCRYSAYSRVMGWIAVIGDLSGISLA